MEINNRIGEAFKTYSVVNYFGKSAGSRLDRAMAESILDMVQDRDPQDEWEIVED